MEGQCLARLSRRGLQFGSREGAKSLNGPYGMGQEFLGGEGAKVFESGQDRYPGGHSKEGREDPGEAVSAYYGRFRPEE